jgi:hypothetical protein
MPVEDIEAFDDAATNVHLIDGQPGRLDTRARDEITRLTDTMHGRMRADYEATKLELLRMQKEQADRDREEREEARKKREKKDAELLELQVSEARAREKRQKLTNKLLGALVVLAGAVTTWFTALRPAPDPEIRPEDVQATVKAQGFEEAGRLNEVERQQSSLRDAVLDQQVQIAESVELITDKIDAAHPRTADKVDESKYEAVARAKKRAKKIREARGDSLLHDEIDALLEKDKRTEP